MAETKSDMAPPQVFEGDQCIVQFLAYLVTLTQDGECPFTVMAHNFQGYNSYPIIVNITDNNYQIEQVCNGGKVLQVTHGKIRFIVKL